jgi:hexokinase
MNHDASCPTVDRDNRTMSDHLRKYESMSVVPTKNLLLELSHDLCSFTLTPQRMRMIMEAFKETLELGLQKPNQIVVCIASLLVLGCPSKHDI